MIDAIETDDPSLVGEAAHIVAEEPNGPRGDSPLTREERNKYSNLVLLCNVHHKMVDDQVGFYTVERLLTIKSEHEQWVRTQLAEFDPERQLEDELWAGYIEEWGRRSKLDDWLVWTSHLLGPIPEIEVAFLDQLTDLNKWLLCRVWPESNQKIRRSLVNFRGILNDLLLLIKKHPDRIWDDEVLRTRKFYQIDEWNPRLHSKLLKDFEFHVDLIHDLTFELTRAANHVCDQIRSGFDRTFRIEQGVLLVERESGFKWYTYRPEYRGSERSDGPYEGMDKFLVDRESRDITIGKGRPQDVEL